MTDLLALTHATERDIDLLLVEEFLASPSFVEWVLTYIRAARSATIRKRAAQTVFCGRLRLKRRSHQSCCLAKMIIWLKRTVTPCRNDQSG